MSQTSAPRIGIIGTGAIGGFYGVLLARAGHDVHFLLRSEYTAVVERGLQLNSSVHGALHLMPVQAYQNIGDMPQCDWLLVGAKTTANAELAPLITRAAAPGAKVVLLQNGLAVEDELRPLLSDDLHLLGGLCYICVHRSAPGVIEHQALGAINLAYHSGPLDDDEARLALVEEGASLLRSTGLDSAAMRDLAQTRWQKLVWNVPYNGLSVLLDADTRRLMDNADSRALIADMMNEVVSAAQALGYAMPENYADKLLAATQRMPDYLPSMYHDFAQRRPAELHAIYEAPLAAADSASFDMPKVRALYQALRFIQARREA
ncbi:putative 2-dehydropantoate 2-reductase [Pseudomonas sp. Z8(2022)]|uniref:putative 2-dehydropantoate 2-reductase n=1 Tax=Pseudomonas sp. Z8(2022) TaxID=2962597 RepID=UPI0021F407A7|nr:putative 2-dehydropantoate 2-reductase [Pseudomonas sp. Z8(2022)]UYP32354.1 putative 2-dehydropantoate 2-reductase [Pseudomonas sp. Z8(2022)]